MEKKIFSVIIVSYKNIEVLINCIESIYKFNDIGNLLEIIIVDNSPEQDIYNYLIENYKNIVVIKNENKGFGQANNIGAIISTGDYLLFLNPDTLLIEPLFRFAIDTFESDNELALFGVKLVDKKLRDNMSFYYIDKYGIIPNQLIKYRNKKNKFIDGKMYISGANIFIRKEAFFSCGMFDEKIFMYNEEPDLIRRIKENKKTNKIGYYKEKKIIHLEGKTTNINMNYEKMLRFEIESYEYYCKKYRINFRKKIKIRRRYELYKMIIYKLCRNINALIKQEVTCRVLKDYCK